MRGKGEALAGLMICVMVASRLFTGLCMSRPPWIPTQIPTQQQNTADPPNSSKTIKANTGNAYKPFRQVVSALLNQ